MKDSFSAGVVQDYSWIAGESSTAHVFPSTEEADFYRLKLHSQQGSYEIFALNADGAPRLRWDGNIEQTVAHPLIRFAFSLTSPPDAVVLALIGRGSLSVTGRR
jgi:hypothetical protein